MFIEAAWGGLGVMV